MERLWGGVGWWREGGVGSREAVRMERLWGGVVGWRGDKVGWEGEAVVVGWRL